MDRKIDDLIAAGWDVIDADFDAAAFKRWREKALECLTELVGPDHAYTQYFNDYVRTFETKAVLAGEGLLISAKNIFEKTQGCLTN